MKHLTAVIVCIAVLYGIDALFYGGWFFNNATKAIEHSYTLQW
jgi:hypothetical protein